jgi:hypothetical protein
MALMRRAIVTARPELPSQQRQSGVVIAGQDVETRPSPSKLR